MISGSSDDSDDNEGDDRCFQRDLFNAVERNNFDKLRCLLDTEQFDMTSVINIRDSNNKNNTLLHTALKKRKHNPDFRNSKKIIDLLIKAGANINATNDVGETPYYIVNKRLKTGSQSIDWISIKNLFLPNEPSCSAEGYSSSYQNPNDNENEAAYTKTKYELHDRKTDCDEPLVHRNPTYKASGLKYSLHGVVYQLQLLMLFLHRATKVYDSFYLATEMDEAEKFDDVVLKYKIYKTDVDWTWRFLQAKHVLNVKKNRIQKSQLFSLNDKLPFSLHKYFLSFCKIRKNIFFHDSHLKDFVICTNAELDQDVAMYFTVDKCSKTDKILFFKHFSFKVYKLHVSARARLADNYMTKFQNSPDNRYLNEFLEKFRFVTNFPNENQLNKLITKEMGDKYGLFNAELVTNTFKSHVLKWLMSYKGGKTEYILISDGKRFLKLIERQIRTLLTSGLSIAYPEKLRSYGISFRCIPEHIGNFVLIENIQILHLVTNSPLLTSVKVVQSIESAGSFKVRDSLIFVSVKQLLLNNIRNLILTSFSSSTSHNLLVITFDSSDKSLYDESLNKFYSSIFIILSDNSFKKLLIISTSRNAGKFQEKCELFVGNTIIRMEDTCTFQDLDDISQEKILNKEVYFQGKCFPLNQILNTEAACEVFDESILIKLIKNSDISIGKSETEAINLKSLYLARTLSRQSVHVQLLQDSTFLAFNIIFLTGDSDKCFDNIDVKAGINVFNDNGDYNNGIVLPPKYATDEINFQIFHKLCNKKENKNIYWIEYKDGILALENFNFSKNNLKSYINEDAHIDDIGDDNFFQFKTFNKKIYIVRGEPGIGKSSFACNLATNLKNANPLHWVIQINLNEYTKQCGNKIGGSKSLEDIKFSEHETQKAIDFLVDVAIPEDFSNTYTCFQRKLLNLSFQNLRSKYTYPKAVVIFDGFDEISPTNKEKTLILLKALQTSDVSHLWITTRTHEALSLEQELKSPALNLNPFNDEQKIQYVTHIFQEYANLSHTIFNTDEVLNSLCSYLEKIQLNSQEQKAAINKINYSWQTQPEPLEKRLKEVLNTDFANNPLHLRMIAEMISKNATSLSNNIDLLCLYSNSVNTKFNIYYNQKSSLDGSVAATELRKRDLRTLQIIHQKIALKELFPHYSREQRIEINSGELLRIGFLVFCQSGMKFVHRTYAEYFFSNYLEENFKNPNVQDILGNFVLHGNGFSLVRKFLNSNNSFLSQLKHAKHSIFKNISEKNSDEWLLDVTITEQNENILKSILINAKINNCNNLEKIKSNLHNLSLKKLTESHRKMLTLIYVILFDIDIFLLLCKDIINNENNFQFFWKDESCLHIWATYYSGSKSKPILDRIYEVALKQEEDLNTHNSNENISLQVICKLLSQECFRRQSVLHKISARGRLDLIQDLIFWVKEKTCNENIIDDLFLMVNYENQSFLHVLKYKNTLTCLLPFLIKTLNYCKFKKLIFLSDSRGKHLLHYYVSSPMIDYTTLNSFLTMLEQNFSKEDIKEIIFKTDVLGRTALHYVGVVREDNDSCILMLKFATSNLKPDICRKLLLLKDDNERTIVYSISCDPMAFSELMDFCNHHFDRDFIQKLIFALDDSKQTILHNVAREDNTSKSLNILLDYVKHYFGSSNLKKLIFQADLDEMTVFHHSCSGDGKSLETLLSYIKDNFDLSTLEQLVFQRDMNGRTGLFYLVQNNVPNSMLSFLKFAKANFSFKILSDLMLATDLKGENILHCGADNKLFCGSFDALLGFLKENYNMLDVLKRLLFKKHNGGMTPFDIARSKYQFKTIYTYFINELSKNSRKTERANSNFTFTRLEVDVLYYHIFEMFHQNKDQETKLIQIFDEYLEEFPIDN